MLLVALALAAPRHDLTVTLTPATGGISAVDTLSGLDGAGPFTVLLHAGLTPTVQSKGWVLTRAGDVEGFGLPVARWTLTAKKKPKQPVVLAYDGVIAHELGTQGEEYQRSFSETPGIIGEQGVYLAPSSVWVPTLVSGDRAVPADFSVKASLPEGWMAVGSGDPDPCEGCTAAFHSPAPTDELYLVAGRWTHTAAEARTANGSTGIDVFLREPDAGLAFRYATATERYLQLYEGMLPPYPFARFALVENFWDTGYGMPGFTLLGPQVIRFPWVLTSSYPHEILHTWWGNSVTIDPAGGNWAEGLTAYMADHLFAEHRGQDAAYRRATLQKFTDMAADKDFPLVSFLGRTSAETEAVGYGKSLMFWHMIRRETGDQAFLDGLSAFYLAERWTPAGFADLEPHLSKASGKDLKPLFEAWTTQKGALQLGVEGVSLSQDGAGWKVTGTITDAGPFGRRSPDAVPLRAARVPVFVTTATGKAAIEAVIDVSGPRTDFAVSVPPEAGAPLRLDVDPLYDTMRVLDAREVAPALSTVYGEAEDVFVLPSRASQAERDAWTELARAWARPGEPKLLTDTDVKAPPAGSWVLGWDNLHASAVAAGAKYAGVALDGKGMTYGRETHGRDSSVVLVTRAEEPSRAVGWVAAGQVEAIPGLARKLPHYTKYSLLAFTGSAPDNSAKASFEPASSPLAVNLTKGPLSAMGKVSGRKALAEMPPRFDADTLKAHATWLADPARAGRQPGTQGMADATAWVEASLEDAGLAPERQTWTATVKDRELELTNLIVTLPGARADLAPVVVLAHLDHLGDGWPEARTGNAGKVHPGADDNASGVAVALEVARALAAEPARPRPVTFVFTTAEEAGIVGAQRWISDAPTPLACISVDAVGRLEGKNPTVMASESAKEWRFLFMGIGYTTGATFEFAAPVTAASDHAVCLGKGIPAVQLTSGANPDYHNPTDTADKLDSAGMVVFADTTLEAVAYLAERTDPLTAQTSAPGEGAAAGGRKASLGTMPDFAFQGPGVKVADVMPGSAALQAGLQAGDVLLALGGESIADLKGYSELLKARAPGDKVKVRYLRAGKETTVEVTLTAR